MTPERPSDPPIQTVGTAHGPVAFTDEGSGPALVLVHGVPGSVRDYRWLAPELDDFRLIRVDLPGFGQTQVGAWGHGVEGRAGAVEAVLEALNVRSCAVVGHSMGGATAAALAGRSVQRVRGLVLLASLGVSEHRGALDPRAARFILGAVDLPLLGDRIWRRVVHGYRERGFPRSTPERAMRAGIEVAAQTDWSAHRANLRAAKVPCLVAWAEDDRLVEPAINRELAAYLGAETLSWPDGGHNVQKTRAVELAVGLRAFTKRCQIGT